MTSNVGLLGGCRNVTDSASLRAGLGRGSRNHKRSHVLQRDYAPTSMTAPLLRRALGIVGHLRLQHVTSRWLQPLDF